MAEIDTDNASLRQDNSDHIENSNTRKKRRLSKRERKNLKKKKENVVDTSTPTSHEPSLSNTATSDIADKGLCVESISTNIATTKHATELPTITLEQYMRDYIPPPITKHLSKQENNNSQIHQNDSLGKWFPKATVIKSSVCYSNDYLMSLSKKNQSSTTSTSSDVEKIEPKASLVLFYQYVNPLWTPSKVSAFSQYIINIMKSHRTNLGGRMRISTEGVNCTVSSASTNNNSSDPAFEAAQTLRHFIQDIKNFDPESFEDTDFKWIDDLSADRHFKEMKILPVKELVYYGIRNGDDTITAANNTSTQQKHQAVIPKDVMGGIHLNPKEYHEMLKKADAVVIDVRNHYEAAIGRFDGQMMLSPTKDKNNGNDEDVVNSSGAAYIDPKMRKSTDFTSWLEDSETKEKLEGKTVMMFCTGGIRCERASAYLNSKMGSQVKGVYQLQGGIERYLQAFPDGGFWRGKNFVFDKREAVAPGNMNGDGGVLKKETGKKKPKSKDGDKLLSWGTECAKCKRPWDRYVGKRKCFTCGVPILLCDECLSQSTTHQKNKKRKNISNGGSDTMEARAVGDKTTEESSIDQVRCPLCVEEGITVPAEQVEYTDNGVRGRTRANSFSEGYEGFTPSATETQMKKAAKSVLKWGGGHASKKKEKRKYSRKLCQFGSDCVRKDCFFYHPEKGSSLTKK